MADDPNIARSLGRTRKVSRAEKSFRTMLGRGALPPGLRKKQLGLKNASSLAPGRASGGPFGSGQGGGLPRPPVASGGMKQASPNLNPRSGRTLSTGGGRTATTGKSATRVGPAPATDTTRSDLSFKPVGPFQSRTASSGSARRTLPRPPARNLGRR